MYTFFDQDNTVVAVMSTQEDGDMRLAQSTYTNENRARFCAKNHIHTDCVVSAGIVHKTHVAVVQNANQKIMKDTDALVTKERGVYLSLTTADCFPVVFYDKKHHIVGIAHAGWRGVVGEIVPRTLDVMMREGADVRDTCVAIGPGISSQFCDFSFCDVIQHFGFYNQDKYIMEGSTMDKVKVDLHKIIVDQLLHHNIPTEHIAHNTTCTYDNPDTFFSARRDGDDFHVMMSVIGMVN